MKLRSLLAFLCVLVAAFSARAQVLTSTWTGAVDNNLAGLLNWNVAPTFLSGNLVFGVATNTALAFDANDVNLLALGGVFTATNVTFSTTTNYTFSGSNSPIFALLGDVTTQAANSVTFNNSLGLRLSNTTHTLTVASGGTMTIKAPITGTGISSALTKAGAGSLFLEGNNSYDGNTTITGGAVTLTNNGKINHPAANTLIGGLGATLTVNGGADLNNQTLRVGFNTTTGFMTIDGAGSTATSGVYTYVGEAGTGSLLITNGGGLTTADMSIGNNTGGTGLVHVSGAGSTLTQTNTLSNPGLFVGSAGTGSLIIDGGATVTSYRGMLGNNIGGSGSVYLDGAGSQWNTTLLTVGGSSTGVLMVVNGGKLSVDGGNGTINLGANSGVNGSLMIGDGTPGGIVSASQITTGAGSGDITFATDATESSPYYFTQTGLSGGPSINVTGAVKFQQTSGYNVLTAASVSTGGAQILGGTLAVQMDGALGSGALIINGGTLMLDDASVINATTFTAGRVAGSGFMPTLAVGANATISPGKTNQIGELFFDHLELGQNGTLEWNLQNPIGGAGSGWDLTHAEASFTLDITATPTNRFTLKLISLDLANNIGAAAGFTAGQTYDWKIFQADNITGGFDPAKFNLDSSQFTTDAGTGAFAIYQSGTDVFLKFTAVPEPSTYALLALGAGFVGLHAWRRRRA